MNAKYFLFFLLSATLLLPACKDDDMSGGGDPCSNEFDKAALFLNVADNLIISSYTRLQNGVNQLSDVVNTFVATPSESNLAIAKNSFLSAYESWQAAAPYEFGPAAEVFLRNSLNNFPLNVDEVNANIQSGSYDFDQPDAFDKGFPALDYLLAGIDMSPASIVEKYSTDPDASKNQAYLLAVIADMQQRITHTRDGWNNGYKTTFISSTGTAAGSSLSLIINNLNENYELIKREKLGVPAGVLTLGFTNPDKVEAFYSGHSKSLALEALKATEQLYLGKTGVGLDDFLNSINAQKDNQLLDIIIKNQFDAAQIALGALSDPLSATIETDPAPVEAAYNEVVKQLVNIKTDLPSVLCVSITYIDNPSDSD